MHLLQECSPFRLGYWCFVLGKYVRVTAGRVPTYLSGKIALNATQ